VVQCVAVCCSVVQCVAVWCNACDVCIYTYTFVTLTHVPWVVLADNQGKHTHT